MHDQFPDADLHYLITGEARGAGVGESLVKEGVAQYGNKPRLKLWVANAGDAIDVEAITDFFDLDITHDYPSPEEHGRQSFYIKGDSMSPTVEQGEVLMADRVWQNQDFEDGAVYMVMTGGQLLCKRVYIDAGDRSLFELVSDNKLHRSIRVEQDKTKLWRVRHRITQKNLGGV